MKLDPEFSAKNADFKPSEPKTNKTSVGYKGHNITDTPPSDLDETNVAAKDAITELTSAKSDSLSLSRNVKELKNSQTSKVEEAARRTLDSEQDTSESGSTGISWNFDEPGEIKATKQETKEDKSKDWDFDEQGQTKTNDAPKKGQADEWDFDGPPVKISTTNDVSSTVSKPQSDDFDFDFDLPRTPTTPNPTKTDPIKQSEAELSFFSMFSRPVDKVEVESNRKVPLPKASKSPTKYQWNTAPIKLTSNELSSLSPKQLLDMSAMGVNISGQQFLDAATTLSSTNPKDPKTLTTLHQLYDKAAEKFIAEGKIDDAFKARASAAQNVQMPNSHPLHNLKASLSTTSSSGVHVSSMDTGIVKGGNIRIDTRNINGFMMDSFEFRISQPARKDLQNSLVAIEDNFSKFQESLPQGMQGKVTISREPYRFQGGAAGHYTPGDAEAIQIDFEGIGKVIIGDNNYGCLNQNVRVEVKAGLPEGEAIKRAHQMLAVIGCGPVLGAQNKESDERMKMAQLFRAYFPAKANNMERTKEFYEVPLSELRKAIVSEEPQMEQIFAKYENDPSLMEKTEIYPGKTIWAVKDLSMQMQKNGALGLMAGVGHNATNLEEGVKAVSLILRGGSLSSLDRLQAGKIIVGASTQEDLQLGGGDQVFTRLINNKIKETNIKNKNGPTKDYAASVIPFTGYVQILYDLDVVNRGSYGYNQDMYGVKNPEHKDFRIYKNRTNLIELAKTTATDNEVMVKNKIGPEFIRGLLVQSKEARDALVKQLIKAEFQIVEQGEKILVLVDGREVPIHTGERFSPEMWSK